MHTIDVWSFARDFQPSGKNNHFHKKAIEFIVNYLEIVHAVLLQKSMVGIKNFRIGDGRERLALLSTRILALES